MAASQRPPAAAPPAVSTAATARNASHPRRPPIKHQHLPPHHHQQQQRKAARRQRTFDPHHQQLYFGRAASNVTDYLRQVVPSHSFHPALLPQPPPSFHRKASSITGHIESEVRPPPRPRRPFTAPDAYYGRRASNVTDHLRYIPPAHLGFEADSKPLPYFGRLATSVTDPSKYDDADGSAGSITCHWSRSRPGSARLPIPPQKVSREVLFQALSARGDHPSDGRRPTSIGSLLKHQFAHLLGQGDDDHDDHQTETSMPSARAKDADGNQVEVSMESPTKECPGAALIGDHQIMQSSRVTIIKDDDDDHVEKPRRNDNTTSLSTSRKQGKCSEENTEKSSNGGAGGDRSAPARGDQSADAARASRPGTAPASAASKKRQNQLLPSPRKGLVPSPRPLSARSSMSERSNEKPNRTASKHEPPSPRSKLHEPSTPPPTSKLYCPSKPTLTCKNTVDDDVIACHDQASSRAEISSTMNDQASSTAAAPINLKELNDLGESMAQSTLCDDNSSEISQDLGSEKLEFVTKWVEQRPHDWTGDSKDQERHKGWPKVADKVADHSRRSTSITKFSIW